MKPEDALKKLTAYAENIAKAQAGYVAVGVVKENVGGKTYKSGAQVTTVAASHEYGLGNTQRSFLRMPFGLKRKQLDMRIKKEFSDVFEHGKKAEKALGLLGVEAMNISKGAFTTGGYGQWPALAQSTISAKGSSQILIDTDVLRSSVTYVVRGL